MPDPVVPQLDELRRRARRRLVGAVVLALAAAVLVPMLLESDPKPLGEDVSVRIPPVDEGKFVSKLAEHAKPADTATGSTSKPDAAANTTPAAKAPSKGGDPSKDVGGASGVSPAKSVAQAEQRVLAPNAKAPAKEAASRVGAPKTAGAALEPGTGQSAPAPVAEKSDAKSASDGSRGSAMEAPKSAPTSSDAKTAAATKAATTAESSKSPATTSDAKPPTTIASKAGAAETAKSPSTVAAAPGGASDAFSVQLAAFADDRGANALAGKLKKAGHPAYTEPYSTSRGTLWRVRVGPYATRDAAEVARAKLKAEGQNGIIAAGR